MAIQVYIHRERPIKFEIYSQISVSSYSLKPIISIRFNLLQVCSSRPKFVFAVCYFKFGTSFNFLSGYFYVSLNLVAVATVRILLKFMT